MMAYIECPKCGREVDDISSDPGWALDGRKPTPEELKEYFDNAKKWTERERVCEAGEFEPPKWKEERGPGCGNVWTPSFSGALIDNEQQHTRIYLSHDPGYYEELLKQDCPLSNWMREEIGKDG